LDGSDGLKRIEKRNKPVPRPPGGGPQISFNRPETDGVSERTACALQSGDEWNDVRQA